MGSPSPCLALVDERVHARDLLAIARRSMKTAPGSRSRVKRIDHRAGRHDDAAVGVVDGLLHDDARVVVESAAVLGCARPRHRRRVDASPDRLQRLAGCQSNPSVPLRQPRRSFRGSPPAGSARRRVDQTRSRRGPGRGGHRREHRGEPPPAKVALTSRRPCQFAIARSEDRISPLMIWDARIQPVNWYRVRLSGGPANVVAALGMRPVGPGSKLTSSAHRVWARPPNAVEVEALRIARVTSSPSVPASTLTATPAGMVAPASGRRRSRLGWASRPCG